MAFLFSKKVYCIFPFLLLLFSRNLLADEAARELAVGEQLSLSVANGSRYSVGNPEVIQVRSTQMENGSVLLLVKGKSQGYSDLLVLGGNAPQKKYSFRVVSKRNNLARKDAEELLRGVGHVQIKSQGDALLVTGERATAKELNLAHTLEQGGKGKLLLLAELDPKERDRVSKDILARLNSLGFKNYRVKAAGSTVALEGIAKTKEEKVLVEAVAREVYAPLLTQVQLPFEEKGVLKFQVQILEMIKSRQQELGLQWSEGIPGFLQLHQALLKGMVSMEASLKALQKLGLAKVLSRPEIALNSEGEAELKVGGEIPIPLRSHNFSAIQWKPYGLTLLIQVPGMGEERVRSKVLVEFTTLDFANAVEGVPATKVNRMQTVVDIAPDKTIFLSGLMQTAMGENMQELPGLASIPILGELFRSKNFQENRSELVIALTAHKGN